MVDEFINKTMEYERRTLTHAVETGRIEGQVQRVKYKLTNRVRPSRLPSFFSTDSGPPDIDAFQTRLKRLVGMGIDKRRYEEWEKSKGGCLVGSMRSLVHEIAKILVTTIEKILSEVSPSTSYIDTYFRDRENAVSEFKRKWF